MLEKFSVKKPMTIVVAVVMVFILGFVSFTNMTTDLMPSIDFPYVIVITSYPGANPEKVESAVTKPIEQALMTTSGVKTVNSTSNENYSMVMLEFNQNMNMDSAMIELSGQLDTVKATLDDAVGAPIVMKINPDMMPVMLVSVDVNGMDVKSLSRYVNDTVIPAFERLDGVASVSATGLVEDRIEITFDPEKIDALNDKVLLSIDKELYDAKQELNDAQKEIADGKKDLEDGKQELQDGKVELEDGKNELADKKGDLYNELGSGSAKLDQAIASLSAMTAQVQTLKAQQAALQGEKKLIESEPTISAGINALDSLLASVPPGTPDETDLSTLAPGAPLPEGVKTVGDAKKMLATLKESKAQIDGILANSPNRIDNINVELDNLNTKIATAEAMAKQLQGALDQAVDGYGQMESGKMQAVNELTKAEIQMSIAESTIEQMEKQLESAQEQLDKGEEQLNDGIKQFEEARDAAYKKANMKGVITPQMLSGILTAENFSMPAGSFEENGESYVVKVGEKFSNLEEIENLMLFAMDTETVGNVYLSDVASVKITDNADESYAKINGNDGVILSFQKTSTASTATVTHDINNAVKEMTGANTDMHITALMDQGMYIDTIISSVLSNLLYGGLLALLILIIFLKDAKPTIIIFFSIPISLLFAVVLMYFSGVTLNVISLSGLALGVGMLVDNSIVVIENIYRLRNLGLTKANAAVQGARQVSGAIFASTLTTICVFLPIVFTEGMTRQLFTDMALTIGYSLIASLIVALTLVPAMASNVLTNTKEKSHRIFDGFIRVYEKALRFSLSHKWVVLVLAVGLLAFSGFQAANMGMSFMPATDSAQMSATLKMPDGATSEDTRAMSDELITRIQQIEGVETVGAMSGGAGVMLGGMGGSGGSGGSDDSMDFYILLKEDRNQTNTDVEKTIYEKTADLNCELTVSSSNMDMSALGGSGVEIVVQGEDLDTIQKIAIDYGEMLKGIEGLTDISTGVEDAPYETRITVDKNKAMEYGLTVAQVYQEVAKAVKVETEATTVTIDNLDYPVVLVQSNELTRDSIKDFVITGTKENEEVDITIGQIATIEQARGYNSIAHDNQIRTLSVTAGVDSDHNIGLVGREIQEKMDQMSVPHGYTVQLKGENESISSALGDLVLMILLAIAFIYLIMVAQFQSLLSPFIVLFTIPLAFTGGLLALWIANMEISVVSMLGFLVLSGVVVNNGIVFVDYANQLRMDGMGKREALITAGKTRMRPILMTALTTILAMSTMALGIGTGADMTQSMAVVTIGGLTYATLLTLFVVPVLYDIFHRRKELRKVEIEEDLDARIKTI